MTNIRKYIRALLENEYRWDISNKKVMMLDKPGMEDSDKETQEKYLKSMSLMEALDL